MGKALLLLILVLFQATPAGPSVTYAWTTPDAAHGTGRVAWSGGELTKCRSTQCALVSLEASGTVDVPGEPPIDFFWRPIPGDRYCVGEVCATVPAPMERRALLPLVSG